jgi:hypothetical protein
MVKINTELANLTSVNAGVPQGSVLGPLLYLLYTADIPTSSDSITATFADDTAVIAIDHDPSIASQKLQASLLELQSWLYNWRMKVNETKSVHVTFTTRRQTCPPVQINNVQIPQDNHVKYLGLHLDRRLTWHTHILAKRKHLGLTLNKICWLLGRKSQLSINNKILIYKVILKPIWTYGIQLWGTTANSNIDILERFQSKVLRMIVGPMARVKFRHP